MAVKTPGSTAQSPSATEDVLEHDTDTDVGEDGLETASPAVDDSTDEDQDEGAVKPPADDVIEPEQTPAEIAIAHLSRPEEPPKEQETATAEEPKATKEPESATAEDKPKDVTAEEPKAPVDESLNDLSPDELRSREKVSKRFNKLRDSYRESQPLIEAGRAFNELLDTEKIRDDLKIMNSKAAADAIRVQAATHRIAAAIDAKQQPSDADVKLMDLVDSNIGKFYEITGRPRPSAPKAATVEFKGDLPKDIKAMVEDYAQIDEEEARLLAGHRAAKAKAAAVTKAPETSVPEKTVEQSRGYSEDDDKTYLALTAQDLLDAGIKQEALQAHYTDNLLPKALDLLKSANPKKDALATFEKLHPQVKRDLINKAQTSWSKATTRTSALRQSAPREQDADDDGESPLSSRVGVASKSGKEMNDLDFRVNYLSNKREE